MPHRPGIAIEYPPNNGLAQASDTFTVRGVASDRGGHEPITIVSVEVQVGSAPPVRAKLTKVHGANRWSFAASVAVRLGINRVSATATNDLGETATATAVFRAVEHVPVPEEHIFVASSLETVQKHRDLSPPRYLDKFTFKSPLLPAHYSLFPPTDDIYADASGSAVLKLNRTTYEVPVLGDRAATGRFISEPVVKDGRLTAEIEIEDDWLVDFDAHVEFYIVATTAPTGWTAIT